MNKDSEFRITYKDVLYIITVFFLIVIILFA